MDIYRDQKENIEEPLIKVIATPAISISVTLDGSEIECDYKAECEYEETTKNIISNESSEHEESLNIITTNQTVDNVQV